jgi:hypothetical protein
VSDATQALAQLLDRKNADGSPLYSDEQVRAAIPMLAAGIARAFPGVTFPKFVVECVGDAAAAAGIDEKTPADQVWPLLEKWTLANQNPLAAEIEKLLRQSAAGSGGIDGARAAAAALGVEVSRQPLDGGVRPEGTVPAGPAARFAALAKTKDNKKKS